MKLGWAVLAAVLLTGLVGTPAASAYPEYQGNLFNDYVGVMTQAEVAFFNDHLREFALRTGVEIAVVIVNDTAGEDLELYAAHLFEEWGIGKRDEHNGLLYLVVTGSNQTRLEVGYGLEPIINSFHANRIITQNMTPRFAQGDYYGGLVDGITAAQLLILGDPEYQNLGTLPEPPLPTWDLFQFHFLALVAGALVVLNAGPFQVVRGLAALAQVATVGVAVYFALTTAPWWFPFAVLGAIPVSYLIALLGVFGLMLIGGRGGGGFSLGGGRSGGGGGSGRW